MQAGIYPEVPDDFGHWLAGFIDGEGSFIIARANVRPGYESFITYFDLKVRDDEELIIREIRRATGIGTIYRRPTRANSHPMIGWRIARRTDCQRLVVILDEFPLRARKARDYAIWREAVAVRAEMRGGLLAGRRPGGDPIRLDAADWSEMRALRARLRDGRRYRTTED